MPESVDQEQQETPKAEVVDTDTKPISLSGYKFTPNDIKIINRDVERELRVRDALTKLQPAEATPVAPEEPEGIEAETNPAPEPEKPSEQKVLYKRHAHIFQVVSYLGLFIKTVIFVILGMAIYALVMFAPPYMSPPNEMPGTPEYEQGVVIAKLVNLVIDVLRAIFIGFDPLLPWLIPAVLIVTFVISVFRSFQNLLLWLFTYRIVTETHIAIIVRLPEGKWAKLLYTAINIDPKSTSIPRSFIGTPDFEQTFWGIVFGFGSATFETAVQYDQAFRHIGYIAGFKKFQKLLDPLNELASA